MTAELIIQYIITGAILIGALIWCAVKIIRTRKAVRKGEAQGACSCCQLSASCKKPKTVTGKKNREDCC